MVCTRLNDFALLENKFFLLNIFFVSYSWSGKPSETEGHVGSKDGETAGKGGEAGARQRQLVKPRAMGGLAQQDWHHPYTVRTQCCITKLQIIKHEGVLRH